MELRGESTTRRTERNPAGKSTQLGVLDVIATVWVYIASPDLINNAQGIVSRMCLPEDASVLLLVAMNTQVDSYSSYQPTLWQSSFSV